MMDGHGAMAGIAGSTVGIGTAVGVIVARLPVFLSVTSPVIPGYLATYSQTA
jgi:hypothetical protein